MADKAAEIRDRTGKDCKGGASELAEGAEPEVARAMARRPLWAAP